MKILIFCFEFHISLFLWVQVISQYWFSMLRYQWCLGAEQATNYCPRTNDSHVIWCHIYVTKPQRVNWGRVAHICASNLTITGSDNGSSPHRCQAIIWTNVGILLIGPLGTNFTEISIEIYTFSFKEMLLKMSSAKWRPFCLGLNVLTLLAHVLRLTVYVPFYMKLCLLSHQNGDKCDRNVAS